MCRLEEGTGTAVAAVLGGCELSDVGCWDPNSEALGQEHLVLTTEPFLQPPPPCFETGLLTGGLVLTKWARLAA